MIIAAFWFLPQSLWAHASLLNLATQTEIDSKGQVTIRFQIRNLSSTSLFELHPKFHFHHTMSGMPVISRLEPGEERTLINTEHPLILRVGRYPLIAMVQYSTVQGDPASFTQSLMGSFYFNEKLESAVEGALQSESDGQESLLKIFLKNRSSSFKNIRLMLLLPPGIQAEAFRQGMIGFTIQGGEEKQFEIAVNRKVGLSSGDYPIYLMIEYGEMQKHYSREVAGTLHFGMSWKETPLWSHVLTFCALVVFLFWIYRVKQQRLIGI